MGKKKGVTESLPPEIYVVIHTGEAEKLNPNSKSHLTFELGKNSETDHCALRLVSNGQSGLFSREWIRLDAIQVILEQQKDCFSSRIFCPLFSQSSTNNAGFLAAVLRSPDICLIEADNNKLFMHRCYPDWQHRLTQLTSLTPL